MEVIEMLSKERILNSAHDFIFALGCLALLLVAGWFSGNIGCVFSWTGNSKINAVNMAYTGDIDENGKYTKRRN